jgi:hypothetical protein
MANKHTEWMEKNNALPEIKKTPVCGKGDTPRTIQDEEYRKRYDKIDWNK